MPDHMSLPQDPRRQLQRAVLFAAVAACLAALLLLAAPALLRQWEGAGQAMTEGDDPLALASASEGRSAWVYRGTTLLGLVCVASTLVGLIGVVRAAARLALPRPDSSAAPPRRRFERPSQVTASEIVADQECELVERVLAVSRATTGILDPDVLARRAVGAIHQAFGPVRVGFFLVDTARGEIALRAGLTENGEAIAPLGHSVGIGEGRLGRCIAASQAVVSSEPSGALLLRPDQEERPDWNEVVIPVRDGGRAIGAIVLQSRDPAAIGDAALAALQEIADQLGAGVGATVSHVEVQTALRSAREALGESTGEGLLRTLPDGVSGYRQKSHGKVEPVWGAWDEEEAQAIAEGQTVRQDQILLLPIYVRGVVVGAARLQKLDAAPAWRDREIGLARAIVGHLGSALESACLRTQLLSVDLRARRTREVGEQLRAAGDWDTLLRTAVQEISGAVGASRVFVQWLPPEAATSGPEPDEQPSAETADP
jgi:GAF domain-containing protein